MILQNLNLKTISLAYEEIFSILEVITNCPILVNFCNLFKELNKEVNIDYQYELQQKNLEISKLKQEIEDITIASLLTEEKKDDESKEKKQENSPGFFKRLFWGNNQNKNTFPVPLPNKIKHKKTDIKCVVVGDNSVGKTSLGVTFTSNAFPSEKDENFFNHYSTKFMVEGLPPVNLELWDLQFREDYQRLRQHFYTKTDVFILCFSLVDPTTLDNIENRWVNEIKFVCPKTPLILVGLKSDLRDEFDQKPNEFMSTVPYAKGIEIAKKIKACTYIECSALKRKNLTEVFENAVTYSLYFP